MSTFDRSRPPEPGTLKPFDVPSVHRSRLPNGLDLLAVRHGRLPVVTAELVVDAGAAADLAQKAGLARLTTRALEAGTESRSAEEVAWELEYLGVELHAEPGWDAAMVRMTVPTERIEPALDLFADLVRHAAFPEGEVMRLRAEQQAEILQRRKEPRALAGDMAARFIFAPEVPYSRPLVGTAAAVATLERDDVESFYRERFVPGAASLLLVGDIDPGAAESFARHRFGDWSGPEPRRVHFEPRPGYQGTTVFLVDRPGSVQSELRIGRVGVERAHPDYFPLLVMNDILGGAFTSRLNMSLRERHGFTYGVQSAFAFRRRPGPFVVQAAVGTEVTARAVEEALREMRMLREEGATAEEVSSSRDYLSGILPLQFQTTDQAASRLADIAVFDLPDDFFRTYRERIASVSVDDVNRVAREHLRPDDLAIVVVGDADSVAEPLRSLDVGPVQVHSPD